MSDPLTPSAHDPAAILRAILGVYALPVDGIHGVSHWARVWSNGVALADATGADRQVVELFALFHDSQRVNENTDTGHGQRGGELARSWRGRLVHLDDARFEQFADACRWHTQGTTSADATVQACWDADRLDLGRVGIRPTPHRLGSDAARSLLNWAHSRAIRMEPPAEVFSLWQCRPTDLLNLWRSTRRST